MTVGACWDARRARWVYGCASVQETNEGSPREAAGGTPDPTAPHRTWARTTSDRLRWAPTTATFIVLTAGLNTALYHLPLFSFATGNLDLATFGGLLTLATLLIVLFLETALLLILPALISHRILKPFCMLLAVGNAVALYFLVTYHVMLDVTMMGNVLVTDFAEASAFLHPTLVVYVLVLGVLPCWLLTRARIRPTMAAICLIALIARRQPRAVWMGVLASAYATALTHALKGLCDTARPAAVLGEWVVVTGPVLKLHSFPSGHTMTAFLLAACFSIGAPRHTRLLLYAVAAAVGLSRVWVGAHWPIDVIAGAGIAGLSVGLAIRTTKFANWGLGLAPHLFLVSLIAVCAVLELTRVPEYPLARLLSIAIAASSLYVLARDYVFRPLFLKQVGVRSMDLVH